MRQPSEWVGFAVHRVRVALKLRPFGPLSEEVHSPHALTAGSLGHVDRLTVTTSKDAFKLADSGGTSIRQADRAEQPSLTLLGFVALPSVGAHLGAKRMAPAADRTFEAGGSSFNFNSSRLCCSYSRGAHGHVCAVASARHSAFDYFFFNMCQM